MSSLISSSSFQWVKRILYSNLFKSPPGADLKVRFKNLILQFLFIFIFLTVV